MAKEKSAKASKGAGGSKGKAGGDIPWPLVGGIVGLIVVLLAVLFTFSGPSTAGPRRAAQQRGEEEPTFDPEEREKLQQYEQLVKSGDEQLQMGITGLTTAKDYYNQALELMPEHPLAYYQLARIAEEERDVQAALDKYYKVLDLLHPTQAEGRKTVHRSIAMVLMNTGNLTGCTKHLKLAVELDGRDAQLRFSLGTALMMQHDSQGALKHLKRATELDKKDPKYFIEYGRLLKATGEEKAGQEQIQLGIRKGDETNLFQIGMYLRQKDPVVAELVLQSILKRFPSHPAAGTVYSVLGQLYDQQGREEDEIQLYRDAVDANVFPSVHQRPMFTYPKLFERKSSAFATEQLRETLAGPIGLLESKSAEIAAELSALAQDASNLDKDEENLAEGGSWSLLQFVQNGLPRNTDVLQTLPTTNAVLQKIRDEYAADMPRSNAELSVLGAGAHIKPHCGPVNFRVRLHLPIATSPEAAIRAGTEQRTWEQGKVLAFDDTFEHEVWNNGTTPRLVLVVDVWHPKLDDEDKDNLREQFGFGQPSQNVPGH